MGLCQLIQSACATKPHHIILIVGDFNYGGINWDDFTINSDSLSDQMFLDTLQDCVLHHVTNPTCYRPGTTPRTLDLVLTNKE